MNAELQSIIEGLEINQETENEGYPAAGTRNITACIGNRVCPYACYDTTALAKRIEKAVFPNDLHFKIAVTGCPNDCGKVRMHDFGIMGMTEPQLDPNRCVSCGACIKKCEKKSVGALTMQNYRPIRDAQKTAPSGMHRNASVAANASSTAPTGPGLVANRSITGSRSWAEPVRRIPGWVRISSSGWMKKPSLRSF